ncbi:MAG: hypothetical protein CEE40_01885 [Chloroflexi bacterium B3_Chlor]|nr:MAG: hypothetical protein CEE40_01885 [Chloroflexi bacterium B3_Chlor]
MTALRQRVAELEGLQEEHRRAEEAAKVHFAELNQIFDTAADGMRVIDKDFTVLRINETFSNLAGTSKDEAVGAKCYETFPGSSCHTPSCPLTRILGGEERVECDVEKERKGGVRIPCIVTATRFRGRDGQLKGIVENFKDITERKLAEEEIRRRNEELVALNAIAETVSQSLDLTDTLEGALDKVLEIMRVEAGGICLADEARQRVTLRAHRGVSEEFAREVGDLEIDEETVRRVEELGRAGKIILVSELLLRDRTLLKALTRAIAREKLRSYVQVLIRIKGSPIGLLVVASRDGRQFTAQEEELLSTIANQIGVGIENARLYEETKRRAGELAALYDVSLEVATQLEVPTLLQTVVQRAIALLGGDGGGFYLYDEERRELELFAAEGFAGCRLGDTLTLGEGASGKAAQGGEPLVVMDYARWEGRSSQFADQPTRNLVAVPVTRADALLGVLYVYDLDLERRFDEGDVRLATLFANYASVAIENARLYEETKRRAGELAALYDVSLELTGQLDLRSVLNALAQRAIDLLGGLAGGLYLYDPQRQDLELIAGRFLHRDYTGLRLSMGEGACGKVAQSGEPLVVTGYHEWDGRSSQFDEGQEFNVLAVPIKRGETLLGALYFNSPDPQGSFDEADIRLATLLANQAAIAIENARLFDQLERRIKQLAALHEVSLDVIATTDFSEALPTIMQKAAQLLDAHGGGIYLSDSATRQLEWRVGYGYEKDYTGMRLALGEGLAGRIAQSKEPLLVDDYSNWDGRSPQWEDEPIVAALGVPLKRGDRLLGVLFVDRWVPGSFDENDLQLATLFANQAAIAIDNARLYEERTRRAEELATLYDMSLKVAGKTELSEVLPRVAYEAAQLLAADVAGIDLFDSQAQELELRVSFGYEKDYAGTRLVLGEGLAGKVAQSKEPMMVDDYSGWEGRSPQWDEEKLRSALAVPLLLGDQFLGVLFLGRQVPRPFDDNDLQLATLFANQTAVAIENARLVEEITSHGKDLQLLSAQLIRAQEEERKRISQELHDEMGQALTAMSINLAAIEKELSPDLASALGQRLAETNGLIAQTLDQMRDLALDLRPSMLDDLGLVPTLRWYLKRYAERLGVDVEFEAIDLEDRLPAEMETVLYRTVQEALTNVARHAHASRVDVRLKRGDSTVTVSIEDDGQGFEVEKVGERELQQRGAGLLGIRERVASLGGSFSIHSAEGQGTQLSIEIPLQRSRPK